MLISLLLRAGRTVPAEVLIDQVWGEHLPSNPANALQVHVSYLRRALGLPTDGRVPALRTVAGGYMLDVAPESIDLFRFERVVASAAGHLEQPGRPGAEDALGAVREALRLWRGEPLQDVADEPFVVAEVERLHELRAAALACEIDARMALGNHDGVVPQLRQLVADFPFRERFWGQLILAQYRCGRQADALRAFDAARRHLVDELGVEPGRELQSLQRAVLEHRSGLEWTPPSAAEQAAASKESEPGGDAERITRGRPRPLPATITRLIGRERELTLRARGADSSFQTPHRSSQGTAPRVRIDHPVGGRPAR